MHTQTKQAAELERTIQQLEVKKGEGIVKQYIILILDNKNRFISKLLFFDTENDAMLCGELTRANEHTVILENKGEEYKVHSVWKLEDGKLVEANYQPAKA